MDENLAAPAALSLYDARPFFEKALQYGLQHGLIDQAKLAAINESAPKGMVQIAGYFGSEYLRPELERARERIVNLVSLYLEESCGGDLRAAAESLRDHSFLSRSKGGSDMLKRLIAMPKTSHFGMNDRHGFTDDLIPQLAKWTLRSLPEYRAELAQRRHAAELLAAATWFAQALEMDADELEDAGAEAEAVVRTALLVRAAGRKALPDWPVLEAVIQTLRAKPGLASPAGIAIPAQLPAPLREVVEDVRLSVLADLPKLLDPSLPLRKRMAQPAFMGRYFWVEDALAELDHHERSASPEWTRATAGHSDEGALLTLFLHLAVGNKPKTSLTETAAATLVRKARKNGLQPVLATQFIEMHAPAALREGYVSLWLDFVSEAQPLLRSDAITATHDALALLRRECVVKAS